jgi:hypothetical protein
VLPNQVYALSWDGLDANQQPLPSSTTASVTFTRTYHVDSETNFQEGGKLIGVVYVRTLSENVVTIEDRKTYPIGTRNVVLEGI